MAFTPTLRRLIFALGLLGLVAAGCDTEQTSELPPPEQFPSSVAYNATTEFLSGPVVTTRITSDKIVSYSDKDSSWAYTLHVDFYDSLGVHTSTLNSDSALIREQARLLEVFGHVLVVSDQGQTLQSQHLAWNDSSQMISTDSFVVITRGEDVMSGYGFRSDPELKRIVFRRQVSGQLTDTKLLEDESRPAVVSDTAAVVADSINENGDDTTLVSPPQMSEPADSSE